jgi:ligand-binding sensor domain-containing protein/two-component sensor histidine kinase
MEVVSEHQVESKGAIRPVVMRWQRNGRAGAVALTGVLAIALSPHAAFGLDPSLALGAYLHSTWNQADGVPIRNVAAISQTDDGFLWIADSAGLYRFDGLGFTMWRPLKNEALPSGKISALSKSPDGDLWIGTSAGISRLRRGHLTNYTKGNGLPEGAVGALVMDHAGRILAGIRNRENSAVAIVDPASGRIDRLISGLEDVYALFEDRNHDVWIGTEKGLARCPSGNPCQLSVLQGSVRAIGEDLWGNLFVIGDARSGIRVLDRGSHQFHQGTGFGPITGAAITTDRDGNLWMGTWGKGLATPRSGKLATLGRERLSSELINAVFEDMNGILWIGTSAGLDQLRNPTIVSLPAVSGISPTLTDVVTSGKGGTVWVGSLGDGIGRIQNGNTSRIVAGLPSQSILSLYEDPSGTLWAGTTGGLVRSDPRGRFHEVQAPGGGHLDRVFTVKGNGLGGLWLVDLKQGLFRIRSSRLEPVASSADKGIYQIHAAPDGSLWIGYFQGGVTNLSSNGSRSYGVKEGLAPGAVQSIESDPAGTLWVGTTEGLSRFQDGRWTTWNSQQGLPAGGVSDIVIDGSHALWALTNAGLLNADLTQFGRSQDGSPLPLSFMVLGPSEGIRTAWTGKTFNPRVFRTTEGKILAATEDGPVMIDPKRHYNNSMAPPVFIEKALVDGRSVDLDRSRQLRIRGEQLEFVFTAIAFASPENVQFRYKLDSLDHDWKEAGLNRRIVYGGLAPGRYRLLVTARNNGPWNPAAASLVFQIPPYFYETWLFRFACLTALGVLVSGAYWYRLRQVRSRFQILYRERLRLTRELHDTLMQGFIGVVYQIGASLLQLETAPQVSKKLLESAVQDAETALGEARQAIASLRLPALENDALPEALAIAVKRLLEGTSITANLKIDRQVEQLPYQLQANLYLIGREAVANAVSHAQPREISLQIAVHGRHYLMVVRDDGSGFDPIAASRDGHLGLSTMPERAKKIRADFKITSSIGNGTTIELSGERRGKDS